MTVNAALEAVCKCKYRVIKIWLLLLIKTEIKSILIHEYYSLDETHLNAVRGLN